MLADLWKRWLSLSPVEFSKIFLENRKNQQHVTNWMSEQTYADSLWQYGIPDRNMFDTINRIEMNVSYTDILVYMSRFLENKKYLEIGVSAGKNFFQLSKQLENSDLYCIDIEEINPVLASQYSEETVVWESPEEYDFKCQGGTIRKKRSSLTRFHEAQNNNSIFYLSGDKFREDLWKKLSGQKFSLVFSDACHLPESLLTEFDFMLQYGLIDTNEFIMVWDDITDQKVLLALQIVISKLKNIFKHNKTFQAVYEVHGTYGGDSKGCHRIGFFVYDEKITPRS